MTDFDGIVRERLKDLYAVRAELARATVALEIARANADGELEVVLDTVARATGLGSRWDLYWRCSRLGLTPKRVADTFGITLQDLRRHAGAASIAIRCVTCGSEWQVEIRALADQQKTRWPCEACHRKSLERVASMREQARQGAESPQSPEGDPPEAELAQVRHELEMVRRHANAAARRAGAIVR